MTTTQPELATHDDRGLGRAPAAIIRRLPLPATFAKFLIVGGIAYLINQFMLFLLYDSPVFWFLPAKDTHLDLALLEITNLRLLISSALAVEVAIVFQFNAHERWTFRDREHNGWGPVRFFKFNVTASLSPVIIVATTYSLTQLADISPYISNTIGVLLGFTWNWTLNTLVIWPQRQKGES